MSKFSISIRHASVVSSVGGDTAATCAALRCRLNNFVETSFLDGENEAVIGAALDWPALGAGVDKLGAMAAAALRELLGAAPDIDLAATPLLLCVAEPGRAGRLADLDSTLFAALARHAGLGHDWHADSALVPEGQAAVSSALAQARRLLYNQGHAAVLVVAVDSLLNRKTLLAHLAERRVLASGVRAGYIPGEAAGALLVTRSDSTAGVELVVFGQGTGQEAAQRGSGLPLRGDGMRAAIVQALDMANTTIDDLGLCIADANGEARKFEELALAQIRTQAAFPLWLPAESLGETGSVAGALPYAMLLAAQQRHYLPSNNALILAGNDSGQCSAVIVAFEYSQAYRAAVEASPLMFKKRSKEGVSHVA